MARAAGIHLTADRLEAIVVDGSAKRWRISGFESHAIPAPAEGETPSAAAVPIIAAALKKLRAPHEPVALVVSSAGAVFRKLQLPFTGDDAIKKVLKFESESHLHQFSIDDVVISHVTVEERKGATDLIIAAAPKKGLRPPIEALDRASYDPTIVDLDALSLFNALIATSSVPETGTVLVLHVGSVETLALLIQDRKLRFVRSMKAGSGTVETPSAAPEPEPEPVAAEVVREGEVVEKDEELIVTFDGPEPEAVLEPGSEAEARDTRRKAIAARLRRETIRTIAAEARHGLQEILICGEGAGLPGLVEELGTAADVPAREIDIAAAVDGAPDEPSLRRRIGVVLGAALKGIGVDRTKTDFRQEELKFAKKLESLKVPLTAAICVVAFGLFLQNIYVYKESVAKLRSLETVADVAKSHVVAAVPKQKGVADRFKDDPPGKRIENYANFLQAESKKMTELFGGTGGSFPKPQSTLDAVQRIFSVIRANEPDIKLIVLDRLTALSRDTPKPQVIVTLNMSFLDGAPEDCAKRIEVLRRELKKQPWCVDVPAASTKPVPNGLSVEGLSITVDLTKEAS